MAFAWRLCTGNRSHAPAGWRSRLGTCSGCQPRSSLCAWSKPASSRPSAYSGWPTCSPGACRLSIIRLSSAIARPGAAPSRSMKHRTSSALNGIDFSWPVAPPESSRKRFGRTCGIGAAPPGDRSLKRLIVCNFLYLGAQRAVPFSGHASEPRGPRAGPFHTAQALRAGVCSPALTSAARATWSRPAFLA